MRCSPSTRMSRTTKLSPCWANAGAVVIARAMHRTAIPIEKSCFTRTSASRQPDDVVVKGKGHEHQQHDDSDLLTDDLGALRHRAALGDLHDLVNDLPTVQQRDR